jgi:multiple sugar transport system ATP-binding protein
MRSGEIQQIDTPMKLYERPVNLFVAGFLGSPAMNFFRGRVVAADGLALDLGTAKLALGEAAGHIAKVGSELIVGLRPEDLVPLGDREAGSGPLLNARLELAEPVGNEIFLNMRAGEHGVVARVPPQAIPAIGTELKLAFRPQRMHLFDPASERRLEAIA